MMTTVSTIKTELVSSDDGEHTYAVTKTLEGVQGDKAVMVLMYPTRNAENIHSEDTTLLHIISHMQDMGLSEITIINLFSKVVKTKLSAKGLEVDDDNMKYIEDEIMAKKDFNDKKFILAYGNSMQSCKACNESKKLIIQMYQMHCPNGTIYQLATKAMPNEKCPHPLWLGIRCKFSKWYLSEVHLPKEKAVEKAVQEVKSKKNTKAREIIKLN